MNIQSVKEDEHRVKYENINVILDEVEMYYHPEYQRLFIDKLLTLIGGLKLDKKKIKSINICIVTHSPFILSDIQKKNILFLKEGKVTNDEVKTETFGANLYDLMLNGFFLDNTFGEFATKKMEKIIKRLNDVDEHDKPIGKQEFEQIDNEINIIGDPFYKQELKRMLIEKTDNNEYKKIILQKQLKEVQTQLDELNDDTNTR